MQMNRTIDRLLTSILLCMMTVFALSGQLSATDRIQVDSMINQWHRAASTGDGPSFFGRMTHDAIYLGTDASERWTRTSMEADLGKYFNGKRAWHFIPYDRTYFSLDNSQDVFFDEYLKTWMGTCRGAGLITKENGMWKIKYYQLSVAVPNDVIKPYLKLLPENAVLKE